MREDVAVLEGIRRTLITSLARHGLIKLSFGNLVGSAIDLPFSGVKNSELLCCSDQVPQRSAAVCTGASHRAFAWPSSTDTVTEAPAMSRAVT
jgi:hypothetical protein